jgi:hypothetical protein
LDGDGGSGVAELEPVDALPPYLAKLVK